MTEPQAKKLNLPLYLNPVVSKTDQVAMTALQQWYKKAKQSGGGPGPEVDGLIREFHRDLYLAGLHLYLINPRLCRHTAEALEQAEPTLEALTQQLESCGLWTTAQTEPGAGSFSPAQVEQLEHLLAAAPRAAETTSDSSALTQQLGSMEAELKQLRALVEEQSRQLRQMKVVAPETPASVSRADNAEEMDVSGMTNQIAQMKEIRKKGVF